MFAKRQTLLLYSQIPNYGFIVKDFDFNESDVLRITHRESNYYFDAFISHEVVDSEGVVDSLYGVMYSPLYKGIVIKVDRVFKKEKIESWEEVISFFSQWLAFLQQEYGVLATQTPAENEQIKLAELGILHTPVLSLASLHPTVQQVTNSRFATAHYSDAISAACTALDKAVQAKAQRPDLNGKPLMDVAFTPRNPLVRLSPNDNEQTGFMLLYQGVIQAIRNHYAHNLTEVTAARALEWLGFISALFYKLDEGTVTPPAP